MQMIKNALDSARSGKRALGSKSCPESRPATDRDAARRKTFARIIDQFSAINLFRCFIGALLALGETRIKIKEKIFQQSHPNAVKNDIGRDSSQGIQMHLINRTIKD